MRHGHVASVVKAGTNDHGKLQTTERPAIKLSGVVLFGFLHGMFATQIINLIISDSAKSKSDKFFKITNWVRLKNKQHHSKVLLNSFPTNGRT